MSLNMPYKSYKVLVLYKDCVNDFPIVLAKIAAAIGSTGRAISISYEAIDNPPDELDKHYPTLGESKELAKTQL